MTQKRRAVGKPEKIDGHMMQRLECGHLVPFAAMFSYNQERGTTAQYDTTYCHECPDEDQEEVE
jgi:hypothetical protein